MSVFARFLATGGVGFVVDLGLLTVLIHAGLGPLAARLISLPAAIAVTFVLNRRVTFASRSAGVARQFMRYCAASGAGIAVNWMVYAAALWFLPPWASLCLACAIALAVNFTLYRTVVFR